MSKNFKTDGDRWSKWDELEDERRARPIAVTAVILMLFILSTFFWVPGYILGIFWTALGTVVLGYTVYFVVFNAVVDMLYSSRINAKIAAARLDRVDEDI